VVCGRREGGEETGLGSGEVEGMWSGSESDADSDNDLYNVAIGYEIYVHHSCDRKEALRSALLVTEHLCASLGRTIGLGPDNL
jgi:hypothetical protein